MRERSPKGGTPRTAGPLAERPACLAEFTLNRKKFRLVVCGTGGVRPAAEVARFDLGGATVAVVEAASLGEAQDIVARLTGRELQIAALVAAGHATKNIAYELSISEWTVGTHMRRIFAKLNVDNRAAMVFRCAPLLDRVAAAGRGDGRRDAWHQKPLKAADPGNPAQDVDLVDA